LTKTLTEYWTSYKEQKFVPVIISASWPSFPTCLAICSPPAKSGSLDGICIDKVLSQEVRSLQPSALLTTRYFEILTFYSFPVLSSPRAKIFLFSLILNDFTAVDDYELSQMTFTEQS